MSRNYTSSPPKAPSWHVAGLLCFALLYIFHAVTSHVTFSVRLIQGASCSVSFEQIPLLVCHCDNTFSTDHATHCVHWLLCWWHGTIFLQRPVTASVATVPSPSCTLTNYPHCLSFLAFECEGTQTMLVNLLLREASKFKMKCNEFVDILCNILKGNSQNNLFTPQPKNISVSLPTCLSVCLPTYCWKLL
jgi:hypothetical protein